MHEFALIKQVLKSLAPALADPNVRRIRKIFVRAGRFTQIKSDHFQECFRLMAKNPKLKGTELAVLADEPIIRCDDCGCVARENGKVCSECGGSSLTRSYKLKEYDVLVESIDAEASSAEGIQPK